jgi:hypothetical protein
LQLDARDGPMMSYGFILSVWALLFAVVGGVYLTALL